MSKFIVKWDCTAQHYYIYIRETNKFVLKTPFYKIAKNYL
jgi:hypothetical protein